MEQLERISEINSPRTQSAVERTGAHYTAQQLATEFGTSSSNLRTRWFKWVTKVAPEPLLKTDAGYTELARTLLGEFRTVNTAEREAWVLDAKHRYAHEWESAGVIEGELMPDEVGSVLALRQTQTTALELSVAEQLANLEAMIDQANTAEVHLSETELRAATARGQKRAIVLHQAELQAELQTTNMLRQRRMNEQ
ncbi:MAG: hypothetical protein AAGA83_25730 [Cyanobacteria bacterium P01_F01_bin.116]